jgi:hypothetical protein
MEPFRENRMVQQVEEFSAELELCALVQLPELDDWDVPIDEVGTTENVAALLPKVPMALG